MRPVEGRGFVRFTFDYCLPIAGVSLVGQNTEPIHFLAQTKPVKTCVGPGNHCGKQKSPVRENDRCRSRTPPSLLLQALHDLLPPRA